MAAISKLSELRARTDRDLAVLLRRGVARAVSLADRHEIAEAEAECTRAAALLPFVKSLPSHEWTALSRQLTSLRTQLDEANCTGARLAS